MQTFRGTLPQNPKGSAESAGEGGGSGDRRPHRTYQKIVQGKCPLYSETKNQPKDRSFRPDVPVDIRPKTSVRPSKSWKNKHFGTDMPRGRPRKNFGLKNFGLIFRSLFISFIFMGPFARALFRKRGGVQKSMGNKVPWKIGMLIYLPVTSRPLISLQKEAVLSPCNFTTNHVTACILNFYLP